MTVVADTGALYALYDADDAHHRQVVQVVKKIRTTIVIPVAILAELDYLLREFLGVDAELSFLDAVMSGHYALESLTMDDLRRCRDLLGIYRDLDLGLADAAVIATAERLKVRQLLTVDVRHFRAVKPKSGPFVLLPSDA